MASFVLLETGDKLLLETGDKLIAEYDAFALALSSQFANGDATTAQLTAPSGKTSGANFQAGNLSESSNPIAAVDLGDGSYSELEWCLKATEAAEAVQYKFRVTKDGVALDTYSATPQWTVSAGGPSIAQEIPAAYQLASGMMIGRVDA